MKLSVPTFTFLMRLLFISILTIACTAAGAVGNHTDEIQAALNNHLSPTEMLTKIMTIHQEAFKKGDAIIYPKKKTFQITIPKGFEAIPLTSHTDFNGCTFIVENTSHKTFLFKLTATTAPIPITLAKNQLKAGVRLALSDTSPKLIFVKDQEVWTNRNDYDAQGHIINTKGTYYRSDLLFAEDNIIVNDPITTYDNASDPVCQYINVSTTPKVFCNLNLVRKESSTAVTDLLYVNQQYNVTIKNISVKTELQSDPLKRFYNDQCFLINNTAKVIMTKVSVDNTYSAQAIWGYAVEMNNVWNCSFKKISIAAIRGGFNTTCSNTLTFDHCQLNRVDVHYYGKDITCRNCSFTNKLNDFHVYNRFASFYGTLVYDHCYFDGHLPVRIDSEYNAFTPFDVVMDNCTLKIPFSQSARYNCICHIPVLEKTQNKREELEKKCLPNLSLSRLTVILPPEVPNFFLFLVGRDHYHRPIYGLNTLKANHITFKHQDSKLVELLICNISLVTDNPLSKTVKNVKTKK